MSVVNTRILFSLTRTRALSLNTCSATHIGQCMIPAQNILANSISSSFVSRGLVSQNVKNVKKEEALALEKLDHIVKNIFGEDDFPKITKKETTIVIQEPEASCLPNTNKQNPIVLLFGWGGASHKNLSKYSSIYLGAGFTTAQYILSTRHIFRDTAQIPEVMANLLIQLEKEDIHDRPVYNVHPLPL